MRCRSLHHSFRRCCVRHRGRPQTRHRLADDSPPVFDWELRAGTTDRIQGALVDVGGIGYEQPLPETALVDRSLYGDVVAAG